MKAAFFRDFFLMTCLLGGIVQGADLFLPQTPGGLVVQLGGDAKLGGRLAVSGRYIIHYVDANPDAVAQARRELKAVNIYGLVSAETLADPLHLPYTENLVNAVTIQVPVKIT